MKKKKEKNFFVRNYSQSWDFIKESKNFIYVTILVFFITFLFGFFFSLPELITNQILEFIQELLEKTKGMSQFELTRLVFLNNIKSSFVVLVFGMVLGIYPVMATIANGFILGFVASIAVGSEGFFVLWRIFPHGIFELPAIFISFGLGLKLGLWLIMGPIKFYWKENKLVLILFILFYLPTFILTLIYNHRFRSKMKKSFLEFKLNFMNSLKVFLFIILPLLIIAAIIEGGLIFLFS